MRPFWHRAGIVGCIAGLVMSMSYTPSFAKTYFEQSIVKDDGSIIVYLQDDEKNLRDSVFSATISGKRKGVSEEVELGESTGATPVTDSDEPINYIILLDNSGSVDGKQFQETVKGIKNFKKKISDIDTITLYKIGMNKKTDKLESVNVDKLDRIKQNDAKNTYLNNAVNTVLKEYSDRNKRAVIILLTDGIDDTKDEKGNEHSDSDESVKENALKDNPTIPVYGIILKNKYHQSPDKIAKTILGMESKNQMRRGFDVSDTSSGEDMTVSEAFDKLKMLMWGQTYEVVFNQQDKNLDEAGFKEIRDENGEKVRGELTLPELKEVEEEPEPTPVSENKEEKEKPQSITVIEEEAGLNIGWILLLALVAILGIVLVLIVHHRKTKVIHVDADPNEFSKSDSVPVRIVITDENGENHEGRWVIEGSLFVGRSEICGLCIADDLLSKQHFVIEVTKSGCFVRDLDSTNGTNVNGVKLEDPRRLADGDVITAGREKFTFYREEA